MYICVVVDGVYICELVVIDGEYLIIISYMYVFVS
jgi:hypothetical protein